MPSHKRHAYSLTLASSNKIVARLPSCDPRSFPHSHSFRAVSGEIPMIRPAASSEIRAAVLPAPPT